MAELSFGPFSVDLAATRVLRQGTDIRLRPQAFHVLKALVLHSGQCVNYEQMIAEAWEGVSVSRHTVDVTVAEVRRSLGEYGSWINHRRKLGYCLEVPTSEDLIRRGWHFWSRVTREGFERALSCFGQAAREDDGNFRAFEGLSVSYLMLATYGMRPPNEMYAKFLQAHGRAEALVGRTPELRSNRAHGLHMFERRLEEAEAEFNQTLREKPTLGLAYINLTMLHATCGRLEAALRVLGEAQKIDPLLPVLPATEAFVRFCRREYEAAVVIGRQALELHPYLQLSRVFLAHALEHSGRVDEALKHWQTARVLSPDLLWLRPLEGVCLVKNKNRREAGEILDELQKLRATEYIDAYFMALLLEALGLRAKAFEELERAVEENSAALFTLDVDPKLDPFREDSRFTRLRDKAFSIH
jgi:DNA-binding winged helix-turn-helix (wHTH) protein/tetratricopeptide (TPR) repeat protein